MAKFYAKEYETPIRSSVLEYDPSSDIPRLNIHSFNKKTDRNTFVENGNRRFSLTAKDANILCKRLFEMTALEAVRSNFI